MVPPQVASEVQLVEACDASVGKETIMSGDVVVDRPSAADTPTHVVSNPLAVSSSKSAQDDVRTVAKMRRKRVPRPSDVVLPALVDDVKELLESQVGKFTHALCAP